jgi:hypothetical protein
MNVLHAAFLGESAPVANVPGGGGRRRRRGPGAGQERAQQAGRRRSQEEGRRRRGAPRRWILPGSVADPNLDPDPHFLGLLDPDPDPSVRGMDPDPDLDPSITKQKK